MNFRAFCTAETVSQTYLKMKYTSFLTKIAVQSLPSKIDIHQF